MPGARRSPGKRRWQNPGSRCSEPSSGDRSPQTVAIWVDRDCLTQNVERTRKNGKGYLMYISFAESCAKGFKRWSAAHLPAGNDNDGGDIPNGVAVTVADAAI